MILITRPQEQARELATILENKNYQCRIEPMLVINYLQPDWHRMLSEPVQAFITTSKHGKRFAPKGHDLVSIPEKGRTAAELCQWIVKNLSRQKAKLVYLRGNMVSFDMAAELRKHVFKVAEAYCYEATGAKELHTDLNNIKIATFFSANSLNTFLTLVDKNKLRSNLKNLKFLCISEEAAAPLKDYSVNETHIADTPDLLGMINKIDEIY